MALNSLKVRNSLGLTPTSVPTNPVNGDIYYDSTANAFLAFQNGVWETISPLTTKGDTFTFSTSNARQSVPADYGALVPDSNQATGWRSASYTQDLQGRPGKNYIQYADAENGTTTGWSLGTIGTLTNGLPTGSPTFGSGAAGTLTLGLLTGSQISGQYSFLLISSAATVQGNMVASSAYTIDNADKAQVLTVRFPYTTVPGLGTNNYSGTSSNSFAWAVWDVTNSVWLSSAGNFNITQSSGVGYCTGTCQTNSNTSSIRLVIYFPNANTGTTDFAFDDVYVGPQTAPSGPAMRDSVAFTPTGTFTTNTTYTGFYRRIGETAQITYLLSFSGAPNSATLNVNLPAGLVIDTTKLPTSSGDGIPLGYGVGIRSGVFQYGITPQYTTTTSVQINYFETASGTNPVNVGPNGALTQAAPYTIANTDSIQFTITVPIAGWSSNTSMSSDTDTRVVAAYGVLQTPTGTLTTSYNVIKFGTVTKDTHAAYNTSTGLYTVPVTGWYNYTTNVQIAGTFALGGYIALQMFQNGSAVQQSIFVTGGANSTEGATLVGGVYCNAGDTLGFYIDTTASGASYSSSASSFYISRVGGPAVIAATESVNARYTGTTGTITGTASAVTFPTKSFDSHNAMSGSTYTIPVSGKYSILATVNLNYTTTAAVNNNVWIYQNGSAVSNVGGGLVNANTASWALVMTDIISCNAGDTIQIYVSSSASSPTVTNSIASHFAICRVCN